MNNTNNTFGIIRDIPSKADETRIIPFVVSTNARDRHQAVANPDGWKLDNYRKNPIVGYMHSPVEDSILPSNPDYVIGHDLNSHIEGRGSSAQLIGMLKFDPPEVNLLAEKVFRKVLFGSLRACSAYFLEIGKGKFGAGEEGKGMSRQTYYYSGQELLEWSIVNVPANPETGIRGKRKVGLYSQSALMYAMRMLGKDYRVSQIKEMRIKDLLDLMEGKDLELKTNDLGKIRGILKDRNSQKDLMARIDQQQKEFKAKYLR